MSESEAMERALDLANSGWGRVSPNPLVGAVILCDGEIVGEGYHSNLGAAHAEVAALAAAAGRTAGGTMIVTLEPCCHHGKTPPCTEAIIAAGIRRVVYAVSDPTEEAGGGAAVLRAAGIEVLGGLMATEATQMNASFLWRAVAERPFVTLKLALSADGAIAAAPGQRTQISGPEAWAEVHRLRAGADAILVGRRTVEVDDPLLTARGIPLPRAIPLRVVLDAGATIPVESSLVRSAHENEVLVFTSMSADSERVASLERIGVMICAVPASAEALLDPAAVLKELFERGVQAVLIEGGARVATSFLSRGLVERFHEFVGPGALGGEAVAGPANLPGPDTAGWTLESTRRLGFDTYRVWERTDAFNRLQQNSTRFMMETA